MPQVHHHESAGGATLETFAWMQRDEQLSRALSYCTPENGSYKDYFRLHDTPVGCGMPRLPEVPGAGGDARSVRELRDEAARQQDQRI